MDRDESEVVVHKTGKRIPVLMVDRKSEPIGRATLEFAGGAEGPKEAGLYSFWSVVSADGQGFVLRTSPGRTIENRVNEYSSMGEDAVQILEERAAVIVPSVRSEIQSWLDTHPRDAQHAKMETLRCEDL